MELLEVYQTLAKEIGITEEIKEDTDPKVIAEAFKTKQAELHKNNPAVMDEEKAKSKKEGEIIATKRIKKTFKNKFGLDLTDSELNDISVDDFAEKVTEVTKQAVGKDVEALQKEVIEITNKKNKEIDDLKAEKEEIEKGWSGKYKDQIRTKVLKNQFDTVEYIGEKDPLFDYFKKSIDLDGIRIEVDDEGKVEGIYKGDMKLLKPNGTNFEDLEGLHKLKMGSFIKKSNGADLHVKTKEGDLPIEKLPEPMQKRLAEMKEKEIEYAK